MPEQTQPTIPGAAEIAAIASLLLGEAGWVMMKSAAYRFLRLEDLQWALVPALMASQFSRFHDNGVPVGFVAWARVSEEIDARIEAGDDVLKPEYWTSGDRHWLMIVLGPEGREQGLIDEVAKGPLKGKTFKYRRTVAGGARETVIVAPQP